MHERPRQDATLTLALDRQSEEQYATYMLGDGERARSGVRTWCAQPEGMNTPSPSRCSKCHAWTPYSRSSSSRWRSCSMKSCERTGSQPGFSSTGVSGSCALGKRCRKSRRKARSVSRSLRCQMSHTAPAPCTAVWEQSHVHRTHMPCCTSTLKRDVVQVRDQAAASSTERCELGRAVGARFAPL